MACPALCASGFGSLMAGSSLRPVVESGSTVGGGGGDDAIVGVGCRVVVKMTLGEAFVWRGFSGLGLAPKAIGEPGVRRRLMELSFLKVEVMLGVALSGAAGSAEEVVGLPEMFVAQATMRDEPVGPVRLPNESTVSDG